MEDVTNPFSTSPSRSPSATPTRSPVLSRTTSHSSTNQRPSAPGSVAGASSPPPTQRASFPDPSKEPRRGTGVLPGPKPKEGFCCERDRQIAQGEEISIIDAFKTTEGGKSSYITYVIRIGTHTVRRRYSSFLSLHQALQGLYPVLIIPPIPSKQSITDYAVKGQSKTKEDVATIATRKRLLEDFLRRVCRHPILGGEHVFHRFLEDGVSWSEVLHSPPISLLPKNPLHAPSHNPTFEDVSGNDDPESTSSTSYIAHHLLPNPSPTHPLHRPDLRFQESEAFTDKFHQHFAHNMEKVNRRATKRWSEHASDMSELGAQWNGFSLMESGPLGTAIEKVGQAVDADFLATTKMLQDWEQSASEPLHTYTQFAQLIKSRLSFRHQKHVQYELVQEALDNQRDKLEILEAAEREARRLEQALERGGVAAGASASAPSSPPAHEDSNIPDIARPSVRRSGQSFGLLSAVKHSLSGMMDVDPEATRRANIAKTRDNISQLEDSLQASAQDLKYASTTLQADLDRFQRQKVADLRELTIQLSTIHRDWCKANLEAWKAAQAAIDEIPDHPNKVPADAAARVASIDRDRDLPPVPDQESRRSSAAQGSVGSPVKRDSLSLGGARSPSKPLSPGIGARSPSNQSNPLPKMGQLNLDSPFSETPFSSHPLGEPTAPENGMDPLGGSMVSPRHTPKPAEDADTPKWPSSPVKSSPPKQKSVDVPPSPKSTQAVKSLNEEARDEDEPQESSKGTLVDRKDSAGSAASVGSKTADIKPADTAKDTKPKTEDVGPLGPL